MSAMLRSSAKQMPPTRIATEMPHETARRRYLGLAGFMVIPLVSIRQKFQKTNNKFQINRNGQISKSQTTLF